MGRHTGTSDSIPSSETTLLSPSFFWEQHVADVRKRSRATVVDPMVLDRSINITFHGVGAPGRPLDPGEEDVWMSREQFLKLLDAVVGRADVALTFDDGNESDLLHALPALRERGLSASFFVVAGRLGTPGFLDEHALRTLVAAGMKIGCHGMRHRPWRGLDNDGLLEELVEARTVIEEAAGRPVKDAACPFGSYDRRVLSTLRRSGYEHVYTSDGGTANSGDFLQSRNSVGPNDEPGVLGRIADLDSHGHKRLARRAKLVAKRWW